MNKRVNKQSKRLMEIWKSDYLFKTVVSSTGSALIGAFFTLYNGILGVLYHSLWNSSICVYYFLLTLIRFIIINFQRKEDAQSHENGNDQRRRLYICTHFLLILMNVSLFAPIAVMVKGDRSFTYGLIPAIAMAAYTTYRITTGIIHFRKSMKFDNCLVSELRTINMVDTLVALLSLQNALIMTNGGMNDEMQQLSAWTSAGVLVVIIVITIRSFLKIKKQ